MCRVSTWSSANSTIPVSLEMLQRDVFLLDVPWRLLQWDQSPRAQGDAHEGMRPQPPSPDSLGLGRHVGRSRPGPQKTLPANRIHTQPLCSPVLLLFRFNFVLVSLGSCPEDIDGTKHGANKIKFSGTVPAGLYEICQYLLRIEVKLN